nr:NS1-NS2AN-FIFO protein [Lammi virus]
SWPAGEIMTAVGLTCAMVGALSGNAMNDIAGPAAAASLIFVAYAISGRSSDVFLEKAGEITWCEEAAVSGSSPRVDVQVTDGGDFSASPRGRNLVAKEWSHGILPGSCRSAPPSDSSIGTDLVWIREERETRNSPVGCATPCGYCFAHRRGWVLPSYVEATNRLNTGGRWSNEGLCVSHNVARHTRSFPNEW